MFFCYHSLALEKSSEHNSKAFITFIDLQKAYDSVPREALLLEHGVPDLIVKLVQVFHQDMKARIQLNGTIMEGINVWNGLI